MVKLVFKVKDRLATEDKKNIVYESDCKNCEAVSFSASKRSLKLRSDEQNRSAQNCNCEKNENEKHCVEKQINTLVGIRRKLLIKKAG